MPNSLLTHKFDAVVSNRVDNRYSRSSLFGDGIFHFGWHYSIDLAMNIVRGNGPKGYDSTAPAVLDHTSTKDVVKCFNTTGFNNMENPQYGEIAIDAFMAGDSSLGKEVARQLAKDAGFAECYDIGGNVNFQIMEQFAFFWINPAGPEQSGEFFNYDGAVHPW